MPTSRPIVDIVMDFRKICVELFGYAFELPSDSGEYKFLMKIQFDGVCNLREINEKLESRYLNVKEEIPK